MTALFLSWNFATIWRTIGWRTKVSIFMKIMMNFPPFKISYFSSFIFQDPLQYNIPSFIHLLHFSTLRELFLRDIGNRVSIFFRGIIFYTIGLVNYFFFFSSDRWNHTKSFRDRGPTPYFRLSHTLLKDFAHVFLTYIISPSKMSYDLTCSKKRSTLVISIIVFPYCISVSLGSYHHDLFHFHPLSSSTFLSFFILSRMNWKNYEKW